MSIWHQLSYARPVLWRTASEAMAMTSVEDIASGNPGCDKPVDYRHGLINLAAVNTRTQWTLPTTSAFDQR